MDNLDIYNTPIYGLKEVEKYVGLTTIQVRDLSSTLPKKYFSPEPVIQKAGNGLFSFNNLVELHTVRSLLPFKDITREHLKEVKSIFLRGNTLEKEHLPFSFQTNPDIPYTTKELLRYAIEEVPRRLRWSNKKAQSFSPYIFSAQNRLVDKTISIDPSINFGKPYITVFGKPTKPIADRYKAGKSIESLEEDYNLSGLAVEAAIIFELGSLER